MKPSLRRRCSMPQDRGTCNGLGEDPDVVLCQEFFDLWPIKEAAGIDTVAHSEQFNAYRLTVDAYVDITGVVQLLTIGPFHTVTKPYVSSVDFFVVFPAHGQSAHTVTTSGGSVLLLVIAARLR